MKQGEKKKSCSCKSREKKKKKKKKKKVALFDKSCPFPVIGFIGVIEETRKEALGKGEKISKGRE
jgi:hypothetical protein